MRLNAITKYWLKHYVSSTLHLCVLCGNSGRIDTRGRAVSAAGLDAGCQTYCICPNGQTLRKVEESTSKK